MQTRILITNGGTHSPADWAEATAGQIIEIADHVAGETRGAAITLQAAIINILAGHHATVQSGEQAKLAASHDRLQDEINPEHHLSLEDVVKQVIDAAKGTKWEADLAAGAEFLRGLLASHFATNMKVERSWHADRNPDVPQAQAFRAATFPKA